MICFGKTTCRTRFFCPFYALFKISPFCIFKSRLQLPCNTAKPNKAKAHHSFLRNNAHECNVPNIAKVSKRGKKISHLVLLLICTLSRKRIIIKYQVNRTCVLEDSVFVAYPSASYLILRPFFFLFIFLFTHNTILKRLVLNFYLGLWLEFVSFFKVLEIQIRRNP